MATTQTSILEKKQRLPDLLAKAPTIENLQPLPIFNTEDEAIEYLAVLSSTQSLTKWEASYLLASIATQYGDATFHRACDRAKISRGTGGRMRWIGQTWPMDIVKRFGNLSYTHFAEVTALMNELLKRGDNTGIEELLEVLYNANEEDECPSAEKVRADAYRIVKKIDVKTSAESGKPFTVRGMILDHPGISLSDGTRRPALVIVLEDEASRIHIVDELKARGLYGQYIACPFRLDDTE